MNQLLQNDYAILFNNIKDRVRSSQYEAFKAVNKALITLYWDIGSLIVERQEDAQSGKSIVAQLAKDLRVEFPDARGFSASNLWRMRQFYKTYTDDEKLAPMVREIGWSHNIVVFERCKDDLQREFYIRMTRKFGWTKNVLIHQIENKSYEKTLLNQTNFDQTVPAEIRQQAKLAVKDEYIFSFLELEREHSERQLEHALLGRIEHFLQEMGGAFAFLGSQYRLEIEDDEYFIDILLYHRYLKCLVALELKIGKFLPEYVGKMQFYLAALDNQVRLPEENPSIGIILCKSKNRTVVEYTLRESTKAIGVATYRIVKSLPADLHNQLPSPEQVAKLLPAIDG